MSQPRRVVFDCNIFLQAMLSIRGPSFACFARVSRGEVALIVSPYVLAEVRSLPEHPELRRFPSFTVERVDQFLTEVLQRAELVVDVPEVFTYARDPDDAHYVNLAMKAGAALIVSRDKDLLALSDPLRAEGREFRRLFPNLRVLLPQQLLQELDATA